MHLKVHFFLLAALLFGACKHDPYPAPEDPSGGNPPSTGGCHPDTVYYERDIQPIFNASCAYSGCHDAVSAQKGVVLTNYSSVMSTADVRPFDPYGSDLYEVIVDQGGDQMPPLPNAPLGLDKVQLIEKWINQGALNKTCSDCDTLNLTYTADIVPLVSTNCISCHSATSASGGVVLETYSQVTDAVTNGNLLQAIRGEAGVASMPPGGSLSTCNLRTVELWVAAGMPN